MLFSLLATLQKWEINGQLWLTEFLQACAEAGGQAPADLDPFLPWNRPEAKHPEAEPNAHPQELDTN